MNDSNQFPLHQILDDEFKRVAQQEDIPMSDLVGQVAELCSVSPRHLYNYRAGKWNIPASLIPIFCRRFQSTALLVALKGAIADGAISIPPSALRTSHSAPAVQQLSIELLREMVNHHSKLTGAFGSSELNRADLTRLEEETERLINRERHLFAMVESEFDRRQDEIRSLERMRA